MSTSSEGATLSEERTIVVCSWQDCPFVADVTSRFAEEHGLTRRESEIRRLVIDDVGTSQIAERLVISMGTVKAHLHRIYKKCGVSGRVELVRAFAAAGRR